MATSGSAASRCFISYVRQDNIDFAEVVDRLSSNLRGRFEASTGRQLEVFIDREAIGWGQDWRQSIRESVLAATVFIPIVTMRYFTSDACRNELLSFYSNADSLGVKQLILPVILSGAEFITAEDSREEVRLIESLNYKNLEPAWLTGYDSPEWRRTIAAMVSELSSALASAESALAAQESAGGGGAAAGGSPLASEEDGAGAPEADVLALGERFDELAQKSRDLIGAMTAFAEAVNDGFSGPDIQALSAQQQRARLIRAAAEIRVPAETFYSRAAAFEQVVSMADAELRGIIDELRSIDYPDAQQQVSTLASTFSDAGDLNTFLGQLDQMAAMLQYASLINVSLRQAIAPGIRAMQATRGAIATAESWKDLGGGAAA